MTPLFWELYLPTLLLLGILVGIMSRLHPIRWWRYRRVQKELARQRLLKQLSALPRLAAMLRADPEYMRETVSRDYQAHYNKALSNYTAHFTRELDKWNALSEQERRRQLDGLATSQDRQARRIH